MIVIFQQHGSHVATMVLPEAPSPDSFMRIKYKRTTHIYRVTESKLTGYDMATVQVEGPIEPPAPTERKLPASDGELILAYEASNRSFAATARVYGCSESTVRKRINEMRIREECDE